MYAGFTISIFTVFSLAWEDLKHQLWLLASNTLPALIVNTKMPSCTNIRQSDENPSKIGNEYFSNSSLLHEVEPRA